MKKADKKHLNKLSELGCIVCLNLGYEASRCEIHHIRSGQGMGQRASHDNAIGLCHHHHRTGGYGVAIHAGQAEFERRYGTEQELLEQVKKLI